MVSSLCRLAAGHARQARLTHLSDGPAAHYPRAGEFSVRYALEGVEVLLTAGALACNAHFHIPLGGLAVDPRVPPMSVSAMQVLFLFSAL